MNVFEICIGEYDRMRPFYSRYFRFRNLIYQRIYIDEY